MQLYSSSLSFRLMLVTIRPVRSRYSSSLSAACFVASRLPASRLRSRPLIALPGAFAVSIAEAAIVFLAASNFALKALASFCASESVVWVALASACSFSLSVRKDATCDCRRALSAEPDDDDLRLSDNSFLSDAMRSAASEKLVS